MKSFDTIFEEAKLKAVKKKQKQIAVEAVRQGGQDKKIKDLFSVIRKEALKEYSEDNVITVESFLTELFEEVMTTDYDKRMAK